MRDFTDADGHTWTAATAGEDGPDYKGRLYLVMTASDGEVVSLPDVRWNSERTARRTLETMSVVELRRRLRAARGRSVSAAAG